MTQAQANQISEMRMQGIGYKSIATVVGLSRDVVRNYCKHHDLSGYGSALKRNVRMRIESGDACSYCGGPIMRPKTGRPKRFCSDKCRRTWWKNHPEEVNRSKEATYELTCKNCGQKFISYGNKNRMYCSHDCYIKYRFWREEDAV